METVTDNSSESLLLMWVLAWVLLSLAAHVCLAWVREARQQPGWRGGWRGLLIAATALGTAISGGMVLALSAESLSFPLGYPPLRVLGLWAASVLLCAPICAILVRSRSLWASVLAGCSFGGFAVLLQSGWIGSVGFLPGVLWRPAYITAASVLVALGLTLSFLLAASDPADKGRRRQLWRLGAAAMTGFALILGQIILIVGAGLPAQVGSAFQDQVPATVLCLIAGVALPPILGVLALDLELRRRSRRRRHRSGRAASSSARIQRADDHAGRV